MVRIKHEDFQPTQQRLVPSDCVVFLGFRVKIIDTICQPNQSQTHDQYRNMVLIMLSSVKNTLFVVSVALVGVASASPLSPSLDNYTIVPLTWRGFNRTDGSEIYISGTIQVSSLN